jgi:hypothetical protein
MIWYALILAARKTAPDLLPDVPFCIKQVPVRIMVNQNGTQTHFH